VQGALGGLIFWFLGINAPVLWAVVMALCSLLPAVGAAIVWFPVAVYFLATGSVWQGVVLLAYGVFVMGLVDNLLRPLLIGKGTQMQLPCADLHARRHRRLRSQRFRHRAGGGGAVHCGVGHILSFAAERA
jgi:hypothetical protein